MNTKTFLVALGVAASFAVTALLVPEASADVTETVTSASAITTHLTLQRISDGGVSMEACGYALTSEGDKWKEGCAKKELTGLAQTKALDILNNAALSQWKTDRKL